MTDLAPGHFYYNYSENRIHIADDPAGRLVETSVHPSLISTDSGQPGVQLRNLVIEKASSAQQQPAVRLNGDGSRVVDTEIRWGHGIGLMVGGDGGAVRRSHIHHIGSTGVGGHSTNATWEYNRIAHNNHAGFSGWEAGASKWVWSSDLTVRRNWVHDNDHAGLWFDVDNRRVDVVENLVERSRRSGIYYEISHDGVIRNNVVLRNGTVDVGYWQGGAGISVSTSVGVEVVGNYLRGNLSGIAVSNDERYPGLGRVWIHGNTVIHPEARTAVGTTGYAAGLSSPVARDYAGRAVRFEGNRYRIADPAKRKWAWGGDRSWREWRLHGNDRDGSLNGR